MVSFRTLSYFNTMKNSNDKSFRIKKKYRSFKSKIETLSANVNKGKVKLEKTKKTLEEVTKKLTISLEEKTNRLNDDIFEQTRSLQQKNNKMTTLKVGLNYLIEQHDINELVYDVLQVNDGEGKYEMNELDEGELEEEIIDKLADDFYIENGFRE